MRVVSRSLSVVLLSACSSSSSAPAQQDAGPTQLVLPPLDASAATSRSSASFSSASGSGGALTTSTSGFTSSSAASSSVGAPTTLTPGSSTLSLIVAGMSRTAVLYVPSGATSTAPLVIALHGDGDTDTNFVATSGLQGLADSDHFVLVAPQGIPRNITVDGMTIPDIDWDAYNSAADGNIDLPLLEQLRTQLQATGQVDVSHTFVFGYSQGGYMSFLYGLSYAAVLSCSGVLAASSPYGGSPGDPLISGAARKLAVAMQIGTQDSAFSAAETTSTTLQAAGFPVQFNAVSGAGHVPIPGDISVPLAYCLGQSL